MGRDYSGDTETDTNNNKAEVLNVEGRTEQDAQIS
jgi:hypothetical protein